MKSIHPLAVGLLVVCLAGCNDGPNQPGTSPPTTSPESKTPAPQSGDVDEHTPQVQADMRKVMQATAAADVNTLLSFTHPKVIEIAGGEEEFKGVLERGLGGMQDSGVTFGELTFPAPPTYIQTKERLYALIPQKITMTIAAGGVETTSFQLGVLENGSTQWKYLDISKFDREMLKEWFPDLPEDTTFPEVSMKQL